MEMTHSALDVYMFFNQIVPAGKTVTVERRAGVVMSLEHFVALVKVVNDEFKKISENPKLAKLLTAAPKK